MPFPFLAGEIPAAETLGELDIYTPALTATTTNPNLGADGEATGRWHRIGPNVIVGGARFILEGTGVSTGSGVWQMSLPLPADLSILSAATAPGPSDVIGSGSLRRVSPAGSAPRNANLVLGLESATTVRLFMDIEATTGLAAYQLSSTSAVLASATEVRFAVSFQYYIEAGT